MDVHAAPEPLSRYLAKTSIAQGGIHIHMSTSHHSLVTLDFFDSEGISLSKPVQRKIENLFGREDYRRAEIMEVGQIDLLSEAVDLYRYGIQKFVGSTLLKDQHARIVLDCAHGSISTIAPVLLGELGCRPIAVNAYPDPNSEPRTQAEKQQLLQNLAAMVPTLGAELGALLDEDATALHVVDDLGRVLAEQVLLLAFAELFFRTEPGAVVAVPSIAPFELEALAEKQGGQIVRTKNSQRSLAISAVQSKAALGCDMEGRFVLPRFQGSADGVAALVELIQRLAQTGVKLSEIVNSLPPLYLGHSSVPCSWELKGEIIRRLGEEAESQDADLSEGVRLNYADGWVQILPDATAPVFHVHAQAQTPQRLKILMSQSQARLETLAGRA
jgi:mannose-1-phosphate guanylyltransferase/phosphomannomutase